MIEKQSVPFHALRVMSLYPSQGRVPVSMRRFFIGLMLLLPNIAFPATGSAPKWLQSSDHWVQERVLYQKAAAELDTGAGNRYLEMRDALDSYPLRVDLDFAVRLGQLHDMTAEQARLFMRSASGTPLASRFLVAYLRHKAQDRRWRAFLDVLDEVPVMPELQCYYYQAQLAVGDRREAYAGAASLWNVGYSQDDACDPLFKAWVSAVGPSDELVWSRALKSFQGRLSRPRSSICVGGRSCRDSSMRTATFRVQDKPFSLLTLTARPLAM